MSLALTMTSRVPVLTYHGVNVSGNETATNDHAALAADLEAIDRLGWRIVSLPDVVQCCVVRGETWAAGRSLTITFDDGTDFDWLDLDHPIHGRQRAMFGLLDDFVRDQDASRTAHATAFVVVSREARTHLDRVGLAGRGWWSDDWWRDATASGRAAIASHSWDHNHDLVAHRMSNPRATGTFRSITTFELAEEEIARATAHLRRAVPNPGDRLFAYPYGEANDYLVREYFPLNHTRLGVDAAFGDRPRPLEPGVDRWSLPRYVCGRDWTDPDGLARLLRSV